MLFSGETQAEDRSPVWALANPRNLLRLLHPRHRTDRLKVSTPGGWRLLRTLVAARHLTE